ncbi:MAG: rhodanese-like domain-containing protein [Chlorobiaceae bacterium]|jgi:rhodanese-related sulfurtransferase|nr:rhodanese-like domain-containing protein [Chlorobiaceae bacterium]
MVKVKDISPSNALAMVRKGALLVDVREPREVARKSFDIPGVVNIPLSTFGKRFTEIASSRKVIIACRSGNRSLMAARILVNSGYTQVFNMQNGIISWERAGLPVKSIPKQTIFSRLMRIFRSNS